MNAMARGRARPEWATPEELQRRAKFSLEYALALGRFPFCEGAEVSIGWAIVSLPGRGDSYEVICVHQGKHYVMAADGPLLEIHVLQELLPPLDLSE